MTGRLHRAVSAYARHAIAKTREATVELAKLHETEYVEHVDALSIDLAAVDVAIAESLSSS